MYEPVGVTDRDAGIVVPLKRDQAYAAIRAAIVRLELEPSSLIDETALCQHLGLGRTPVREALQRLHHEGLVTIFPRRGIIVAPISMLELLHLTQARLIWEPNVARLAAEIAQPHVWDGLEAILAETPIAYVTLAEVEAATAVNGRFHRGIAAATGNPYLVELVEQNECRQARLAFIFFRYGVGDPMTGQHYDILAALRARDGDRAAALMEQHINVTRERQVRLLHMW